ncbi:ribosome biogenesis GTPase A [Bacillus ectoiniformans]|uniref:SE1561 family protein n=1 Tax=Bacillus ectoiniformans TaxID=1494429 RepID=UPI00195F1FF7|nr:SE1561 family protein [Bacillus ectoiniformans]MBM7650228.1 ribosome biogenesis GTPase A [Bacillus ectoiniformans]
MGKPVHDKNSQITYLKERLNIFMEVLDSMDPEMTEVEDVDRLLEMIDDIEMKCDQFSKRSEDN